MILDAVNSESKVQSDISFNAAADPKALATFQVALNAEKANSSQVTHDAAPIEIEDHVVEEIPLDLATATENFDFSTAVHTLKESDQIQDAINADEELGTDESISELWAAIETTSLEDGPTAREQAIFDAYELTPEDVKEYKEDPYISRGAYFSSMAADHADTYIAENEGAFYMMDIDENDNLVLYVVTPDGDKAEADEVNEGLQHTADWVQNSGSMVVNTGLLNGMSLHFTNDFITRYGEVGESPETSPFKTTDDSSEEGEEAD